MAREDDFIYSVFEEKENIYVTEVGQYVFATRLQAIQSCPKDGVFTKIFGNYRKLGECMYENTEVNDAIQRTGHIFGFILHYLNTLEVIVPKKYSDFQTLLSEAGFYELSDFSDALCRHTVHESTFGLEEEIIAEELQASSSFRFSQHSPLHGHSRHRRLSMQPELVRSMDAGRRVGADLTSASGASVVARRERNGAEDAGFARGGTDKDVGNSVSSEDATEQLEEVIKIHVNPIHGDEIGEVGEEHEVATPSLSKSSDTKHDDLMSTLKVPEIRHTLQPPGGVTDGKIIRDRLSQSLPQSPTSHTRANTPEDSESHHTRNITSATPRRRRHSADLSIYELTSLLLSRSLLHEQKWPKRKPRFFPSSTIIVRSELIGNKDKIIICGKRDDLFRTFHLDYGTQITEDSEICGDDFFDYEMHWKRHYAKLSYEMLFKQFLKRNGYKLICISCKQSIKKQRIPEPRPVDVDVTPSKQMTLPGDSAGHLDSEPDVEIPSDTRDWIFYRHRIPVT